MKRGLLHANAPLSDFMNADALHFRRCAFVLHTITGSMGMRCICISSDWIVLLQRSIIVPPEQGYGKQGLLEIPPNATFELQVQVLSVK